MAAVAENEDRIFVSGAVIAGGASRRMGSDKRGVLVDGLPMLRRTALAVRGVTDELLVACGREAPPDPAILRSLDARLVYDRLPYAGPLVGIEAALAGAAGELVLVVAGDMPWLEPAVLRLLVRLARDHAECDAVVLRTERGAQPLVAVYRRAVLARVTDLLDAGIRRAQALLETISTLEVGDDLWRSFDPAGRTALNVNGPEDLAIPPAPRPDCEAD